METPVYVHLLLNHFPIILPIAGMGILISGLIFSSDHLKRTAYIIFIISTLFAIPTYLSGGEAEHIIEKLPGISETIIEKHEEAAEIFAPIHYLLGVVSLLSLWSNIRQKAYASILGYIVGIIVMALFYFAVQTGTSGGEIRRQNSAIEQALPSATDD